MAEVKKYSGRSYAKSLQQQEAAASKAFDEIFAKPKATNMKWGNASYAKPRNEEEDESKKQKVDSEESSDPFSFEFDSDRSPKKKQTRLQPRTVVMQPAVRITSSSKQAINPQPSRHSTLDDDTPADDFIVKKGVMRPYTKRAGRRIKDEQSSSDDPIEMFSKPDNKKQREFYSTDFSHGTPSSGSEIGDSQEVSDDLDDDLYIENDDGAASKTRQEEIFSQSMEEEENIFKRPKRDAEHSMLNIEGEEITVKFRSQYLNPEVYSKFTENVTPKDPVGALLNSKVVHKNVLKHDLGTTLIVVCSPKVSGSELKQTHTQTKYFKDNIKDIVKSKYKPVERLTRARKGIKKKPAGIDPFELDDAPDVLSAQSQNVEKQTEDEESPIVISSSTDARQSDNTESNEEKMIIGSSQASGSKSVDVEEVVKSVKAAPPRKYHRIFRSRNKGYMEPQEETQQMEEPSSEGDTIYTVSQDSDVAMSQESSKETVSQENGKSTDEMESQDTRSEESVKGTPVYL